MPSSYEYQPLKSVSLIRLIKLSPELINDHVACQICDFDIIAGLVYHALSYCWGDPEPTQTIYFNGFEHPVHENLGHFLHQKNHKELGHQVRRMNEIYGDAVDVIIWLGHDQKSKTAIELVHRWLPHSVLGYSDDRPHEDVELEAVIYLLLRPYWARIWIAQEVISAQKAFVTYGSISVDLEDSASSVRVYRQAHPEFDWRPTVWKLCDLRKTGGRNPLWKLLTQFNLCESSKLQDRVYGLLGLMADESPQCRTKGLLEVNYAKDVQDVFWDAMFAYGAPWSECGSLLLHVSQTLGERIDSCNFRSLEDYSTKKPLLGGTLEAPKWHCVCSKP